ncbi:unnamed protein product [Rotaria sp. Silwood1]|nr:unnamed protein product [Rotaria sp. Silwood1]
MNPAFSAKIYLKPLIIEQCAKVTKTTVVYPSERYGTIRRIADQRRFNNDSYLEKFDLTVNINKMLMSPAKILQTPEIRYKSSLGDGVNHTMQFFGNVKLGTQYAGRIIQQCSSKGKIVLEIIKDLHLFVENLLCEFSTHNSRLSKKLVFRTVIDTDVVSSNRLNFYLHSHAAIQDRSRAMLYQILHDGIGFT